MAMLTLDVYTGSSRGFGKAPVTRSALQRLFAAAIVSNQFRTTLLHEPERALANAEQGANRLQRTLEQLLLLARLEGQLPLEDDEPLLARDVAELAIHDVSPAPVALHLLEPLPDAPLAMPSVLAITALRNLLENAVRHTPAGTGVELWVEQEGGQVRFTVRDHGPGVPETHLPRLTQRFWSQGKGNGLGLAIVQAIAERCAARLAFDNRSDGLRVSLSVPLRG